MSKKMRRLKKITTKKKREKGDKIQLKYDKKITKKTPRKQGGKNHNKIR